MNTIITVDGPSGAGKGTLCQLLAKATGYALLDSGALYRLTALAAIKAEVALTDVQALAKLAAGLDIAFNAAEQGVTVLLAGKDVTREIREEAVGMAASQVAALQPVRDALLMRQRAFADGSGLVADGRDMGTVVFPSAAVKFFLTASAEERAKRRVLQLESVGQKADERQILTDIEARDKRDRERASSPLVPAADAILLDSTKMTIDQVFEYAMATIKKAALPS
ncbi:(d)CMP kinase [Marinagarivorans cellulosilyticus]|uniref:Cytidylate kinase n=1 Tax=Marinagarivorans cellulosilyticus TaxID=2721545 RepID=A0AAN1WJN5_9GAMM|nr:(d)CMP kinase [Marinagarivorans cellulosilyticus]BCD98812.1 CMP/dCMP kinase [Marinagarivorans cellulosilyticus]